MAPPRRAAAVAASTLLSSASSSSLASSQPSSSAPAAASTAAAGPSAARAPRNAPPPAAVEPPLSPVVRRLRQMWTFAAVCQFMFTFDEAFGVSGFETEVSGPLRVEQTACADSRWARKVRRAATCCRCQTANCHGAGP
jgi:hypothetical protein